MSVSPTSGSVALTSVTAVEFSGLESAAGVRYLPSWMEIVVTLGVISAELWVFRWVVNRMPVLDFAMGHGERSTARPVAARSAA